MLTCKNCGAQVTGDTCEYCGTVYNQIKEDTDGVYTFIFDGATYKVRLESIRQYTTQDVDWRDVDGKLIHKLKTCQEFIFYSV